MSNSTSRSFGQPVWTFLYDFRILILLALFGLYMLKFWPGQLTADSGSVFAQMLSGSFDDHHPPLFGYLWMFLHKIWPGQGLMFAFQISLLWVTAYYLTTIIGPRWPILFGLFFPLYPGLFAYNLFIWKDIHFTNVFAFTAAFLTYKQLKCQKLNLLQLISFISLLFYGASVKYQARFILPIMITWISLHQFWILNPNRKKTSLIFISIIGLALGVSLSQSLDRVNRLIVPQTTTSHAWELVKIFDLAGMSIQADQLLVPKFLLKDPNKISLSEIEHEDNALDVGPEQDLDAIKEHVKKHGYDDTFYLNVMRRHYDLLWEPLVVYKTSPLGRTNNDEQRKELRKVWHQSVKDHPIAYLKHRFRLWSYLLHQNSLQRTLEKLTVRVHYGLVL